MTAETLPLAELLAKAGDDGRAGAEGRGHGPQHDEARVSALVVCDLTCCSHAALSYHYAPHRHARFHGALACLRLRATTGKCRAVPFPYA
jgi:hypothetical protein